MQWPSPFASLLFVCAIATIWAAAHASRNRRRVGAAPAVALLGITIWSLGYAVAISIFDLPTRILWAKAQYLGIGLTSSAMMVFVLRIAGNAGRLTKRQVLIVSLVPGIGTLLAWTNEVHHLIWTSLQLKIENSLALLDISYGPYFWLYAAYNYLILIISIGIFLRARRRFALLQRQQALLVLVCVSIPSALLLIYLTRASPWPNLDPAPIGLSIAGIVAVWGLVRFSLLDLVPVARDALIEKLPEGVLVLDDQERVVDINPSAQATFETDSAAAIGKNVQTLFPAWADVVRSSRE
jgi:PAS domain-containing protein